MTLDIDDQALLFRLSDAPGPPGFEEEVRDLVLELGRPLADRVEVDPLGSTVLWLDGPDVPPVLVDAHLDEVGFITNHVEATGGLRIATLGGWDARVLPAQPLRVRGDGTWREGIVGSTPPHLQEGTPEKAKVSELVVDVGTDAAERTRELGIDVGSPLVPATRARPLVDGRVAGKAFDDRAGCTVALRLLERFADLSVEERPAPLAFAFSVREEVGARGARVAVERVRPRLALCLEGTMAADVPGVAERRNPTCLGDGPAFSLADGGAIYAPELTDRLRRAAGEAGVPWQHKRPTFGGTDAKAIQTGAGGVPCACVSVPCRYIHSAHAILDLDDLAATVETTHRFLADIADLL